MTKAIALEDAVALFSGTVVGPLAAWFANYLLKPDASKIEENTLKTASVWLGAQSAPDLQELGLLLAASAVAMAGAGENLQSEPG